MPDDALDFLRTTADFFVTGVNDSLAEDARIVLLNAIRTQEGIEETVKKLSGIFTPWVGDPNVIRDGNVISPARLETIVRTNATRAMNMGRVVQARRAGRIVTGFEYSAIIDSRTTDVCRFLDGMIFRRDDPDLDRLSPPRHFNCRSVWVAVTLDIQIDEGDFITRQNVGRGLELSQKGF